MSAPVTGLRHKAKRQSWRPDPALCGPASGSCSFQGKRLENTFNVIMSSCEMMLNDTAPGNMEPRANSP